MVDSPYATKAWTYTQEVEDVEDVDETEVQTDWMSPISHEPYVLRSWTLFQDVIEVEDDGDSEGDEQSIPFFPGPILNPYSTKTWAYHQVVVEEDEAPEPVSVDWSVHDEPPPLFTAWKYYQDETYELEFFPVSLKLFFIYDEDYFPRTKGPGTILDSGYFGQVREAVYDSAYYEGGERGLLMKRKIARVLVYDQLASSPGDISTIAQPLGSIATDPTTTPAIDLAADGDVAGAILEAVRNSIPSDDRPPGTLLGSVSYEIFGNTATITDWEHLNWQDDTPVLKAVQVIINDLPDCVSELKVLDPPHAFWTSLGFRPDYKGDPYLHYRLV